MPTPFFSHAATLSVGGQLHPVLFGSSPRLGHQFRKARLPRRPGGLPAAGLPGAWTRCIHWSSIQTASLCLSAPALKHTLFITRYFFFLLDTSLSWVVQVGFYIDINFLCIGGFYYLFLSLEDSNKIFVITARLILMELRTSPLKWNPNSLLSTQACHNQPACRPAPARSFHRACQRDLFVCPRMCQHSHVPGWYRLFSPGKALNPLQTSLRQRCVPPLSSSHPSLETCASAVHHLHCHLPKFLEMTPFTETNCNLY